MSTIIAKRPTRAELERAREILAAEEAALAKERGALVDPGPSELLYKTSQVTYSLPCYGLDIVEGLQLGYCEHASREFGPRSAIPADPPRFILGTVTRVYGTPGDETMRIEFDEPPANYRAVSVDTSVHHAAKYCIPADRKAAERHLGQLQAARLRR